MFVTVVLEPPPPSTVTTAPKIGAPDESVTLPLITPASCAGALCTPNRSATIVSQSTALTWRAASLDATFLGIDRISPPASGPLSTQPSADRNRRERAIDIPFRKTGNARIFSVLFDLDLRRNCHPIDTCRFSGHLPNIRAGPPIYLFADTPPQPVGEISPAFPALAAR